MTRRNIKLVVAYDGTDFSGWQRQAEERSVQGEIEKALAKIHKAPVVLTGSGRTDAGVHASGQAANFYTTISSMDAPRFVPALNSLLPRDVRICDASEVPPSFHARFDAKSRTYRYHIAAAKRALPWELRYSWQLWRCPRLDTLNDYARCLLGERDCTVFASPADQSLSRSRSITRSVFFIDTNGFLVFEISANAFLWKMVRSIVGTLLFYEEKNIPAEDFRSILESGDRGLAGPTAPPNGLFLRHVDYYGMMAT